MLKLPKINRFMALFDCYDKKLNFTVFNLLIIYIIINKKTYDYYTIIKFVMGSHLEQTLL